MRGSLALLFWLIWTTSWAQINGTVADDHHETLIGAHLLLLPDSVNAVADANGQFSIKPKFDGPKILRVSFIGHDPTELRLVYRGRPVQMNIDLHLHAHNLNEVVVEDHHSTAEASLTSEHIKAEKMELMATGTLIGALDGVSGVSAINLGVGIAKPVIRGLTGNRVIVTTDNIKQEGQQWGMDHGLEADPFDAGDIEVVKGPASLQYGSDGLGGAINIMPRKMPTLNTFEGSTTGTFRSNNLHGGGSVRLGFNRKNVFGAVRYSSQEFGDYAVPADSFAYLGYQLPIYDRKLKNTAGREQSISGTLGLLRDKYLIRLDVSNYGLRSGLFSGAVGAARSYALQPDGNNRDIAKPMQRVNHLKAVLTQQFYLAKGDLHVHLGYQRNKREEYSFPEYHSQASRDLTDTLALGLELHTGTLNMHFEHRASKKLNLTYGLDVQAQHSARSGFEHLLPNYTTTREGLYAIAHWHPDSRTTFTAGLRADHGYNASPYRRQFVYRSDGTVRDSLVSPAYDGHFYNASGSVGVSYGVVPGKWDLKAHVGKSFRVPHPVELVSNGIHHGTFRHEQGNPDLKSEHGYQLDFSNHFHIQRFTATATGYFNYFDNYIYLGPTGRFSNLPEAGQIFGYQQHDAIYTGAEADWNWDIWRGIYVKQIFDLVWNINLETSLPLPFTPPPSLTSELGWTLRKSTFFDQLQIYVRHRHGWAQNRVDRNERTTPAFDLFDVGFMMDMNLAGQSIQLAFTVQNLTDAAWLNHLSRYRLLNLPEQGRNFVVTLRVPFSIKLHQSAAAH